MAPRLLVRSFRAPIRSHSTRVDPNHSQNTSAPTALPSQSDRASLVPHPWGEAPQSVEFSPSSSSSAFPSQSSPPPPPPHTPPEGQNGASSSSLPPIPSLSLAPSHHS